MQRQVDPRRPEVPPPPRPPRPPPRRLGTAAWVALAAALCAVGVTGGVLTLVAIRGDDDAPGPERERAAEPGITVGPAERLSVPGVAEVTVLKVERMKRLPPRDRGAR